MKVTTVSNISKIKKRKKILKLLTTRAINILNFEKIFALHKNQIAQNCKKILQTIDLT